MDAHDQLLKRADRRFCKAGPEAGFTLLEVVIAVAVFAALFLSIASVMHSSATVAIEESAESYTNASVRRLMDAVVEVLDFAQVSSVSGDGRSITYMVPVDPAGDGSSWVDANGALQLGAREAGGDVVGNTETLGFVEDPSMPGTGIGNMVLTTSGGFSRILPGRLLFLAASSAPIFALENGGSSVRIRLSYTWTDIKGRAHVKSLESVVAPRN